MKLTETSGVKIYGMARQELGISHSFLAAVVKGSHVVLPDGSIDVRGNVIIPPEFPYEEIPVKFNTVSGHVTCCAANANGEKHPDRSRLALLTGMPKKVGGYFSCDNTSILSLHGGPEHVGDDYHCSNTKIGTFAGGPSYVGNNLVCTHTDLHTIEHAPEYIGKGFYCSHNLLLKSLKGIHKVIKHCEIFNCDYNDLSENVLGLLLIPDIKQIKLTRYDGDNSPRGVIEALFKKALRNELDIYAIQQYLIDNGLEKFARL